MDGPLVCGLLCLLLCLVAAAPQGRAPDSPLTTGRQGHSWQTADLPEVHLTRRIYPWDPVIIPTNPRIRRQTKNKKKRRPHPGYNSVLSMRADHVKVPTRSRTKRNADKATFKLVGNAP